MLARLALVVARRRWIVIGAWVALTFFGMFSAAKVSDRWFQSFSLPGYASYEASQRLLERFGNGERSAIVVVFKGKGDVTKSAEVKAATERIAHAQPGIRTASYFSTGSDAYVSADRRTTFMQIYPAGVVKFDSTTGADKLLAAARQGLPSGVSADVTGIDVLYEQNAKGSTGGPSILVESLIGFAGALVILLFVFGTLPAVLMPIAVAVASILNTFSLIWALTYLTDVSIIVQFLIALVGLGVAIDYALLMLFRFRDELREGRDVETALVETMTHAGKAVIVSGTTVAVGLLSLLVLPLPFIRSMGIGGMLIPAVSVVTAITLLPALLSVLGERVNSVRVMPKRFLDKGHPEDGAWGRWARFVNRRAWATAAVGLAITGTLVFFGLQVNPNNAQAKNIPGSGVAFDGRDALAAAGISAGVLTPFEIVVEHGADPLTIADRVASVDGIVGAVAPSDWRKGDMSVVEAFPAVDGSADEIGGITDRLDNALAGTDATTSGGPAVNLDFIDALYGNFPYLLAFVLVLTYILLARAFRSLVLPLKAVLLNLVSLAASYGIIVFIFQKGHGSQLWDMQATQAIVAWIPIMIFAFLFGLSMDYEVFMISRIRESYDETGSTDAAIELGLARTGKLVTSAALVLMFAFITLSLGPGFDVKQFAIGLAAGIIFDATVIRALLVPSLMKLMGNANWYFPAWAGKVLRVEKRERLEEALETV